MSTPRTYLGRGPDPGRVTARLPAGRFLVGEPGQPSTMAPIRAGTICAVEGCPVCGDRGGYNGLQWSQTDTHPGLQMAGAGAQHDTRLMPVGAHGVHDLVIGAVQIEEHVAGIAVARKGMKEDVVSLAITESQECHCGAPGELHRGPNPLSGKGLAAAAVNQTNLVIVARHGRQLPAHSLQGEEESAIHDRDSNIGPGVSPLKAELLTLQKTGTSHFALTCDCRPLTPKTLGDNFLRYPGHLEVRSPVQEADT